MINENLVDFELYAAVHVAFTLWLLKSLQRSVMILLNPKI
jgi:hypothetical protein